MKTKLLLLVVVLFSLSAHAERADRDKPVNLDADKITVDDSKKTHVFEGNVLLTQGTLSIKADKIVVSQDVNGYQIGVATGGPDGLARFRQKREGRDEYIDGEAERIVNDAKLDKSELFGSAKMRSGLDEVRGQYIAYDGKTENYVVTNGPGGAVAPGGKAERVHATIQPKNKEGAKQPTK
jgi:lipopolysaccharide export system protein LptA